MNRRFGFSRDEAVRLKRAQENAFITEKIENNLEIVRRVLKLNI